LDFKDRPTIILVDDDVSVLRALRRLLHSAGFKVLTFQRPSEVLSAQLPSVDACLVLDIHLTEMNGAELYEFMKAAGCALPVIAMTGATDEATRRLIQRLDAIVVLWKPFERDALLTAVAKAIGSTNL
jgi:FixJ family two-component response regulator